MKKYVALAVFLALVGLSFRLFLAWRLPNDEPDDGRLYARIAKNVLEHRSYSISTEEPYSPTFIRVPGYPVFIAGVYAAFGRDNNLAVRVVQAVVDTITCWLIALLALSWAPVSWPREKRRRLLLVALGMAVSCPFPAIYVATILTESCTMLLVVTCALAASLAINSRSRLKGVWLWAASGLSGGVAAMFRPDSGLFLAAVGFTLVLVGLSRAISSWRSGVDRANDGASGGARRILIWTLVCGLMLTVGAAAAMAPWTIRNARVFGLFQPLAPQYANMPGEFVPRGYIDWLRTWVDDVKYTESFEFPLDVGPLRIEQAPHYAFDSPEEREQVAALLARYNGPPPKPRSEPPPPASTGPKAQEPPARQKEPSPGANAESDEETPEADDSEADEETDDADAEEETKPQVEMTPDIDAGFAEIARARIARHPLRHYLIVPLKRAASLWFDTHSQYYPFEGELLPLSGLDRDHSQQYWLPLFASLTLLYTIFGVASAWLLWRDRPSRRQLLLLGLLIFPRLAFLSSLENPEPRYVVGFFAFVIAAASLSLTDLIWDGWLKRIAVWFRRSESKTTASKSNRL